jgi:tetratricopeptide (TPR) repeat protein
MKILYLDRVSKAEVAPAIMKRVADQSLELAEQAIADDNYPAARGLLGIAKAASDKARLLPIQVRVEARTKEVLELEKEYAAAGAAFQTLTKKPGDVDAGLKWGRFLCYYKASWDEGLPFLAKAGDARLRLLADEDLRKPTSPKVQVKLGDDWYSQADKNQGLARKNILLRAKYWYEKALPTIPVGEFERTRVETRLKDISAQVSRDDGDKPGPPPILPLETYERQMAIGVNALNRLRLYKNAIDAFTEALKYKPGDPEALKLLSTSRYAFHLENAATAMDRKEFNRAISEYTAALKERPGDLVASNGLSAAKFKLSGK